ncbi:MAG: response regulator transcription factor [Vicinamibacteria bacterium]|nr:response regulator transcription factor [Vicinamibacteria bacterium]
MTDTSKLITVGLVDGRKAVNGRLCKALTEVAGMACVMAADTAGAVRLVRAQTVDVLLVDLHLAPAGALGMLDPLLQVSPDTRPVILVPAGAEFDPAALVSHGARGFLAADADGTLLRKCVRTVHGGEYWLARDQVGPLLEHLRTDAPVGRASSLDVLTPREHDIVRAVLRGSSNGAIASDFALSPQTVRNHLSSIYLKLGVSTRLELALLVMHVQRRSRP